MNLVDNLRENFRAILKLSLQTSVSYVLLEWIPLSRWNINLHTTSLNRSVTFKHFVLISYYLHYVHRFVNFLLLNDVTDAEVGIFVTKDSVLANGWYNVLVGRIS